MVQKWHQKKINRRNLFNEQVSIEVGALVLKECMVLKKYNEVKALSCYNGSNNTIYYNKVKKQENILSSYIKNQTVSTVAQGD